MASQPPAVDPYDMPGTSYSTPGLSAYSAGGASGSGGPSTSTASGAPGPARPARARPRRSREETVSKRPREEPGDVGSVGSVPASRGDLQRSMNQEWSCRLVTLALGRWRQEDQGFEASLCSLLSLRPAWTARDYYLKKKVGLGVREVKGVTVTLSLLSWGSFEASRHRDLNHVSIPAPKEQWLLWLLFGVLEGKEFCQGW